MMASTGATKVQIAFVPLPEESQQLHKNIKHTLNTTFYEENKTVYWLHMAIHMCHLLFVVVV